MGKANNWHFLFNFRLEYFSVMFNILLSMIYLCTDGLSLIGWHIPKNGDVAARIFVTLKLLLWSFVFLNLLPFKFLIPTLYGRKFFIWINSFFLLWYGSCIWNSVSFFSKLNQEKFFLTKNWLFSEKGRVITRIILNIFSPFCNISIIKFTIQTATQMIALGKNRFLGMRFSFNSLYDIANCWLFKMFPFHFYHCSVQVYFDQGNKRNTSFEEYSKCAHWNTVKRYGTERRCKSLP